MKILRWQGSRFIRIVLFLLIAGSLNACNTANKYYQIKGELDQTPGSDAKEDIANCERAIDDYSRAIKIDPKSANNYYRLGCSYSHLAEYRKDQIPKAIENFSKAIELNPKFSEAYRDRGKIYVDSGQYQRAIDDCSKAIAIDSNDQGAYFTRAKAYQNLGKADLAEKDREKTLSLRNRLKKSL